MVVPLPGFEFDRERVHQTARAHQAKTHSACRTVLAIEDRLEAGDAGTLVADADHETLGDRGRVQHKLGAAATGITESITREFGNGGRNAGLILALESQQLRNPVRALANGDYISFVLDGHGDDRP